MKKNMTRILMLVAALVLALSMSVAYADEAAPEAEAAASTTAYIFWQDQDWWPAAWEQEDDYWAPTPAVVTGEGWYTAKLDAHMPSWFYSGGNSNIGAQKFALIVKDGADLFPGMYLQIVDIRVDGVSYPCSPVTYGQTGYDNINDQEGGKVYWDANDTYALIYDQWMIDNGGSIETGTTWDSTAAAQNFNAFDVSALNNPHSIEIDFFLSAQQDVKPEGGPALRVKGEGPTMLRYTTDPTNLPGKAYMLWQDQDWWPAVTDKQDSYWTPTTAAVTGEGFYTVGVQAHMPDWFYSGGNSNIGAQKLAVIIDNGSQMFPNLYMNITDVRINGVSHEVGDVTYGRTWYDNIGDDGTVFWTEDDTYGLMYDQWQLDKGGSIDGTTWDSSATAQNFNILDVSKLNNPDNIEIDFFLSSERDVVPEQQEEWKPEWKRTWYPNNTMGIAGYSLRDLGIGNKWINVVPVNLTEDGYYKIPLVASNKFILGNAIVTVSGDDVSVTYETDWASPGNLTINSECVKWFKSIDEITEEFVNNPTSDIAFGDVVSKAELGDIAYLYINNGVTFCQPIADNGIYSPKYNHTHVIWEAYRAELDAMVEAATPAAE